MDGCRQQPQPSEFAEVLGNLFAENAGLPTDQPPMTKTQWMMGEFKRAITCSKSNREVDDAVGWLLSFLSPKCVMLHV